MLQDGKGICPETLEFPIGGEYKDVKCQGPSRQTCSHLSFCDHRAEDVKKVLVCSDPSRCEPTAEMSVPEKGVRTDPGEKTGPNTYPSIGTDNFA